MHKTIEFEKNLVVDKFNVHSIESEMEFVKSTLDLASTVFDVLDSTQVIKITKSGTYHIKSDEVSSKNLKLDISENIDVNIYEYNNSSNVLVDFELNISRGSTVTYVVIDQNNNSNTNRYIKVDGDSILHFDIVNFSLGKNISKINIDLQKENAQCYLKAVSIAVGETVNKFCTTINNYAPKTNAVIWQKAVVKENGRNEFLATGHIAKGCDEAKNFQESRVLLLDGASTGDASPVLLIDHYNVEAGHAASVSRVSEDELYYLQSRGITKEVAENLVTVAFVKPLIDEISDENLREEVLKKVKTKLELE